MASSSSHQKQKQVLPGPTKCCPTWFTLCSNNKNNRDSGVELSTKDVVVVYVLGGPGSGKGTQSYKIAQHFGFTHLSTGELLDTQVESGSKTGKMIQEYKKDGGLVPSEVVVKLLKQEMRRRGNNKFVIDGFPRNEENRIAAEKLLRIQPAIVLVFDCSEEELIRRMLNRNQGRVDDNMETIQKRLKVYRESTLPVIDYYTRKGKVRKINAERPADEVFKSVEAVFSELGFGKHEVVDVHTA